VSNTKTKAARGKPAAPKAKAPAAPRPVGRPSIYDRCAAEVCKRLARGEFLTDICADDGMPGLSTISDWLTNGKHPEFPAMYARAREARVQLLADDILRIADDARGDVKTIAGKNGEPIEVVDHENIQRSRLKVDARKWLLTKLAPGQYGERVEVAAPTPPEARPAHDQPSEGLAALLKKLETITGQRAEEA
jgi:hypothetical protein